MVDISIAYRRSYTAANRRLWFVLVDGQATAETFDTKADANAQAEYLRQAAAVLSAIGAKGGRAKSAAKSAASKANGAKGGRPRRRLAPCPVCGSGVVDAKARHLDWRALDTFCDGPA